MQACYEFGVLRTRTAAVPLAIFALWLPAAALADSAGDNQYQDPFSNVPSQPKKQSSTNTTPAPTSSTAPTQTSAPAATPTSTPTATTATPSSASSAQELPRTGFPLWPAAAVGAALIAAGLGLRRLVSDR
jgi:cytoskeletal protein RodZ